MDHGRLGGKDGGKLDRLLNQKNSEISKPKGSKKQPNKEQSKLTALK